MKNIFAILALSIVAVSAQTITNIVALESTARTNVVTRKLMTPQQRATNHPPSRPFIVVTNAVTRHTLTLSWRGKTRTITDDEK